MSLIEQANFFVDRGDSPPENRSDAAFSHAGIYLIDGKKKLTSVRDVCPFPTPSRGSNGFCRCAHPIRIIGPIGRWRQHLESFFVYTSELWLTNK